MVILLMEENHVIRRYTIPPDAGGVIRFGTPSDNQKRISGRADSPIGWRQLFSHYTLLIALPRFFSEKSCLKQRLPFQTDALRTAVSIGAHA